MCTNHTNFSVERLLSNISSHSQQLKFLSECSDCSLKELNGSSEADFKYHGNSMPLNQTTQIEPTNAVQCENSDAVQVKRPLPMRPKPITIGKCLSVIYNYLLFIYHLCFNTDINPEKKI